MSNFLLTLISHKNYDFYIIHVKHKITMTGILYLLPNTLGANNVQTETTLNHTIPKQVQSLIARLDYFIAENAKTTRALLNVIAKSTPLAQPIQHLLINELNVNTPKNSLLELLRPIVEGRDAGLMSEAGLPAIADPGAELVNLAHTFEISVKPMVGPSSLLLALMASGLNGQSFAFQGYLPTNSTSRSARIVELEKRSQRDNQTQIFIETPYRNDLLMQAFLSTCSSQTQLCVATDLTLDSELIQTFSIAQWKNRDGQLKPINLHKKPSVFLMLARQR